MDFEFFLTENTSNYEVKMFGNTQTYQWESGGSFASDFSEKKWYDGILIIQDKLTKKEDILFFKTYQIRDEKLFPFIIGCILGVPTNYLSGGSILHKTIDSFCKKVLENSIKKEASPFRFIEIPIGFVETIPDSGYDAQIQAFANYGGKRD